VWNLLADALTIAALILSVPVAVLTVEVAAATVLKGRAESEDGANQMRPQIAVLIPAHNEGAGLLPTISDVQAQLRLGDRLLVVADNCTDDTAKVARSAGAEVVERNDPEKVGKGYALDWGVRQLQANPPDVVIMVDADCRLGQRAIDRLALSCQATGRPTQALYRMMETLDAMDAGEQRVAYFAWLVKTYIRPMGLAKLGLPCQLMGTGMAFPWEVIHAVNLASGNLVEDLKLGLDLAASGTAPRLCLETYVESTFPTSESGKLTQRRRWEAGSLRTLIRNAPVFLWNAMVNRNLPLLVLALDALVPPLVILAAGLVAFLLIAALAALANIAVAPLFITLAALLLFTLGLIVAWAVYGRAVLRAGDFRYIIGYLLQKLHIYRPGAGRGLQWTRTDRQ
jgi:cellulose synthase/poly-beta-1,6-N-acetylglucosamine synthase-like glycosyltransferase